MHRGHRRDALAVGAAVLAHTGLFAAALHFWGDVRPAEASTFGLEHPDAIEIDFVDPPEPPRPVPPVPIVAPEPDRRADPRGNGVPAGASRETLPELPPAPGPEPAPSASAAPDAAPAATGDVYSAPPAVPMPGDVRGTGLSPWVATGTLPTGPDVPGAGTTGGTTGPLAPRVAPAPGAGKTALRDEMRARDGDLGIGNAGGTTIANEVAIAARTGAVPNEATAVLVARVSGDGTLISLTVQRFDSGDASAWKSVAQAARAALAKRKLGLAGLGPKGAVVHIDVRSAMTYPSGAKDRVKGPKGLLELLKDGPARDVAPAPSPDGDSCAPERWSDLKPVCGVGLKLGTFDTTDAVTGKKRSVRASVRITLLDGPAPAAPTSTTVPASTAAPSVAPSTPKAPPDAGAP